MQERNKTTAGAASSSSMPVLPPPAQAPAKLQQHPQQQQQHPPQHQPQQQHQQQQQPPSSQQLSQTQAQAATAMQAQLAERQLNERRARERVAEQERQKKEMERAKAAEEVVRKQRQQAAEKMRQHQEAAAKLNQSRESTKLQMQNLKAQTEQQRAAAAAAATVAPTAPTAAKRQSDSSSSKRKASSTSSVTSVNSATAASSAARATPVRPIVEAEAPPREYSEFMEMIDHAVDYDWTTAGLLLGNKADIDLNAEQRTLLYGKHVPKPPSDHKVRRGWGDRNILSARAAWAKVRLPETERESKESKSATPVVAGISLPSDTVDSTKIKTTWFNEDKAETDRTLALLSEATEIYVKQVLEKALICARQRENLEGIRLWHAQHSASKPPLGLRLGCDVTRQVALASGNAARTVQRMEEALERNPAAKRDLSDPEVLADATSMGDLACRPKLAAGAEKAAYQAKRSFEVSGGKDAGSPPWSCSKAGETHGA
ncbi:hypothetical protein MHU86_3997 [Fragilaria crotonensis]|nr:hypothetical protein MHU86_3997 [Fragilaria crotonensis]